MYGHGRSLRSGLSQFLPHQRMIPRLTPRAAHANDSYEPHGSGLPITYLKAGTIRTTCISRCSKAPFHFYLSRNCAKSRRPPIVAAHYPTLFMRFKVQSL